MKEHLTGLLVTTKQIEDLKEILNDLDNDICSKKDAARWLKYFIEDIEMANEKIKQKTSQIER